MVIVVWLALDSQAITKIGTHIFFSCSSSHRLNRAKDPTDQFRRNEISAAEIHFLSQCFFFLLHILSIGSWWIITLEEEKVRVCALALDGACARYERRYTTNIEKEKKKTHREQQFFPSLLSCSFHRFLSVCTNLDDERKTWKNTNHVLIVVYRARFWFRGDVKGDLSEREPDAENCPKKTR